MDRRSFLRAATGAGALLSAQSSLRADPTLPNVIFLYADDLGYGDLGCYGSQIPPPNIDQMAAEGVRFPHFTSASTTFPPPRAACLTGRPAPRTNAPYVRSPPADTTGMSM